MQHVLPAWLHRGGKLVYVMTKPVFGAESMEFKLVFYQKSRYEHCVACSAVRVRVCVCICVCLKIGLKVDVHVSDFKSLRYQIQTWAALLGLTNEELLCEKRRNLQHLPFIYIGGPMWTGVCVCVCASGSTGGCCVYIYENVFKNG